MTEQRKLRVISICHDIPHHEVTIKAELDGPSIPLESGDAVYLLTGFEIAEMTFEHDKLFKKYTETHEELLRYKRLMKDFKLLMEESE